jgi:uncharacterized protein (DUF58 family)
MWGLVALGLPVALAGVAFPGFERLLWPYNGVLFGLYWVGAVMAKRSVPVAAFRHVGRALSVRVPNTVTVKVTSQSSTVERLEILDEPPEGFSAIRNRWRTTLRPGDTKTFAYEVTPRRRGRQRFVGLFVRHWALWGLAEAVRRLDVETVAVVYPNVRAVRDFELLKQRGRLNLAGLRRSRVRGAGTEFESLRDYQDDDFRFIDWSSTARLGRLVARNYEVERNQAVMVCVDAGRHMLGEVAGRTKLDFCLDAALMLLHTADRAGDQVGFFAFHDEVLGFVAPQRGKFQVARIVEAMHDIEPEPVQPDYAGALSYMTGRWKRRSLVVVFTDAEDTDQARGLARALGRLARRHLVVVVQVADPKIKEIHAAPLADERALFLKAAAVWYREGRRQAGAALRAAGIRKLEAEPTDLAKAVVSSYLRIKERSEL